MQMRVLGIYLLFVLFMTIGCAQKSATYEKLSKVYVNLLPTSYRLHFTKFRKSHINGLMMVQVVVENLSNHRYDDIEYCFKWYDRRFNEVGEYLTIWQPLYINARDTKEIKALAPLPSVKRYKFLVRKRGK